MSGVHKVIKTLAICLAIFIIMNIVGGIFWGLSLVTNIGISEDKVVVEKFAEIYQDVSSIDINTITSNLVIKPGSEFKVEASNLKNNFNSKLRNGTLKIEENKAWFLSSNPSGTITIYIPQEISKLKIDAGAGKIQVDNTVAKDFDLNQGAGSITISNCKFAKADIEGGAGEIKISSSKLNNLDLDAGVGRVNVEAEITGNSKIECGVGEMNIALIGEEDEYRIIAEKGIGSIKIDNEEQKVENMHYGAGNRTIRINGGIGAISVNFIHYQ